MKSFVRTLSGLVFGVLSGFDRLMVRGHLRELMYPGGMNRYCNFSGVKLTGFGSHAEQLTGRLIATSEAEAQRLGRPIEYLASPKLRKEDHARAIARRDGIDDGLIALFKCVEPCWSFSLRGNRATKKLEFRPELRQCLHLYQYYQHPFFGFCYARIQTWFPFTIQIGLNGREWLARQLDGAGLAYRRHDNCITWVEDVAAAQKLLDAQLRVSWSKRLSELGSRVHPSHPELLGKCRLDYYWSLKQSEWASDVLFTKPSELSARYGAWLRHAMTNVHSADVLRYLGKKLTASGEVNGHYADEVLTDLGRRVEGVRIKHRAGDNSIKMYDKAGGPGAAGGDDDQRPEPVQGVPGEGERPGRGEGLATVAFGGGGCPSPRPGQPGGQRAVSGRAGVNGSRGAAEGLARTAGSSRRRARVEEPETARSKSDEWRRCGAARCNRSRRVPGQRASQPGCGGRPECQAGCGCGGTKAPVGASQSLPAPAACPRSDPQSPQNPPLSGDHARPRDPHRAPRRPPRLDAKADGPDRLEFFARLEEIEPL